MTLTNDAKMEAMESLRELREQLKDLENQGLHDSPEYEEISEDYQTLALDVLPVFSEEHYCTLYVYEHDFDKETPFGDYDSFTTACDIGDEMLEADEILGYYVDFHDDEETEDEEECP